MVNFSEIFSFSIQRIFFEEKSREKLFGKISPELLCPFVAPCSGCDELFCISIDDGDKFSTKEVEDSMLS